MFQILVWLYVVVLLVATIAPTDWHADISNPYDIDRLIGLGVAGLLARLAYPQTPSFVCLLMIGIVCGLGFARYAAVGNFGSPMDCIVAMAGALWGIALAAAFSKVRFSSVGKRPQLN
ncbi:hypothetical protein [Rhizobium tubonense]|uniref:hypothetical protein n=1 Tax=Rhizobium tubonense TaxID=484088 RepID=UPI0011B5CACF|nr:hypothetical protein [Rhizobium tubonense]